MDNKKFKMTEEIIGIHGTILHRIVALRDFNNVHAGDKGGFVEKEQNLSQEGDCWIYGNAKVFNNAEVMDSAIVRGQYAEVGGYAKICGNAIVEGNSVIQGSIRIADFAKIAGRVFIQGYGNIISGSTVIKGFEDKLNKSIGERKSKDDIAMSNGIIILGANIHDSRIFDDVIIRDGASATIKNSKISGDITIGSYSHIDNSTICGTFTIGDGAIIRNNNYYSDNKGLAFYYTIKSPNSKDKPVLTVSVGDQVFWSKAEFKTVIKKPTISPDLRNFYKSALKTAQKYIKICNFHDWR